MAKRRRQVSNPVPVRLFREATKTDFAAAAYYLAEQLERGEALMILHDSIDILRRRDDLPLLQYDYYEEDED